MKAETKVLVQNDMIEANIINLLFFILKCKYFLNFNINLLIALQMSLLKIHFKYIVLDVIPFNLKPF